MKNQPQANYLQVGKAIECGHCHPEKFAEGLKEAEKMIPNFKCDCICHMETRGRSRTLEEIKSKVEKLHAPPVRKEIIPEEELIRKYQVYEILENMEK